MSELSAGQWAALVVIAAAYFLVIRQLRVWERYERARRATGRHAVDTADEARRWCRVVGSAMSTPVPREPIKEKRVA